MGQIGHVSSGFWITLSPISTPVELLSFQFRRQLDTIFTFDTHTITALITSILIYIYLGYRTYKCKKEKEDIKAPYLSLGVYISVILVMCIISIIISQAVLFSRYLFVMTGLYIFWMSFMMTQEKNKFLTIGICAVIVVLGTISNITNIKMHYYHGNEEVYNYIRREIEPDDIFVYSNIGNGGVMAAMFPEHKQYFLCDPSWDVKEAYRAYGPGMETIENLANRKHRLELFRWIYRKNLACRF